MLTNPLGAHRSNITLPKALCQRLSPNVTGETESWTSLQVDELRVLVGKVRIRLLATVQEVLLNNESGDAKLVALVRMGLKVC